MHSYDPDDMSLWIRVIKSSASLTLFGFFIILLRLLAFVSRSLLADGTLAACVDVPERVWRAPGTKILDSARNCSLWLLVLPRRTAAIDDSATTSLVSAAVNFPPNGRAVGM